MDVRVIILVCVSLTGIVANPVNENENKVGCLVCHPVVDNKINVHLIPHSHDDVGWLKTVEQYYYGTDTYTKHAGVQSIITSVYEALLENPDRRFMQVETQYFWLWWKDQNEDTRSKYKKLVENGQIEMANGAWSMNDEACANYQSTIDQYTWGLRTLSDTVGDCGRPRVGWQIDPFGHSREQASLLSQFGYDAMIFARLDHDDKIHRMKNKSMDFAWQGSQNLVLLYELYELFSCLHILKCTNSSSNSISFSLLECLMYKTTGNCVHTEHEVKTFTTLTKSYANYFSTNNIIIPMGGDFQFEAAEKNYNNMDKFIKAFEGNSEINVIYSTPSCYIKAVNDAIDTELTLKTDDFFPYSNNKHSFWTGYFTSRPNSKRFERTGHNILQATKQLFAQNSFLTNKIFDENLRYLREVMGIMQHHDAITGTEKQHVANDYVKRLTRGIEYAENGLGKIVDELLGNDLNLDLTSCLLSNISICTVSQSADQFITVVYNPLAWEITHYVRLPVEEGTYEVNGGDIPHDLIPTINDFNYVVLKEGTPSAYELVFAAKELPPLGLKIYHVKKTSDKLSEDKSTDTFKSKAFKIGNNNLLASVTLNGNNYGLTQNFKYYFSETGEDDYSFIASGAYIFRPTKEEPESLDNIEITYSINGNVVDEVHQKWTEGAVDILQIIRWYHDEDYLEFDWIVGNIDVTKVRQGKEIITKFTVTDDFNNGNNFYTDSNGREMLKRTKNSRPDYSYNATIEPVAGNYYPVTSKIVMKDDSKDIEIAVLTDRSQGGSSLKTNELELMVHRRLLKDDGKGVGESLNEVEFQRGIYVRGSHYLIVGKASGSNANGKTTAALERILAQKKLVQPWIGVAETDKSYDELKEDAKLTYEGLESSLPENVNILTFEPWTEKEYLLRLEHIMEKNDDVNLSKSVTVDIAVSKFREFYIEQSEFSISNCSADNHFLKACLWSLSLFFDSFTLLNLGLSNSDLTLDNNKNHMRRNLGYRNAFKHFAIEKMTETTLAANELLAHYQRRKKYTWKTNKPQVSKTLITGEADDDDALAPISLKPMQIRTFIVKLTNKQDIPVDDFGVMLKPVTSIIILIAILAYLL
ncbi:unnamed protein product [Psylliodes chrysocephalus]|uniref:Alpha-mannosidase n=1 Tax=Psylliodes chrysocephalus TaxID=3402493 RepID=A0A9P0CDF2_9CUCU|nr:unnamed protein product [Psylliodes chrysocephala]